MSAIILHSPTSSTIDPPTPLGIAPSNRTWGHQRRHVSTAKSQVEATAFTLIELLVVISVIGVLASLIVGLSGLAGRRGKESRMLADLNRLVTQIESYKSRIGYYPPSSEILEPDRTGVQRPSRFNQLYYELTGTLFRTGAGEGVFSIPGRENQSSLTTSAIERLFGVEGFANSARDKRNIRFTTSFKPTEVKTVVVRGVTIETLVAPVGPPARIPSGPNAPLMIDLTTGGKAYPWFYDASSAQRNNSDGFDLWTEVVIGKNIVRFSNWETGPVVVGTL